jgi:hypothetical protein
LDQRKDEAIGGWRQLHNEKFHNLYSSPSIIRIIKSRKMRCVGHIALMGENRNAYMLLMEKPKVKKHLEDQDVSG